MSRSRSGVRTSAGRPRTVRSLGSAAGLRRSSGSALCLATVSPRDRNAEDNVKTTECRGHDDVAPCDRKNDRDDAGEEKADPHDWNDADGKRAAGDDTRAVEHEPEPGEHRDQRRLIEDRRQHGADDDRRGEAHRELSTWAGKSEEHTSELQSLAYLVCRLLLEKKNHECHFFVV